MSDWKYITGSIESDEFNEEEYDTEEQARAACREGERVFACRRRTPEEFRKLFVETCDYHRDCLIEHLDEAAVEELWADESLTNYIHDLEGAIDAAIDAAGQEFRRQLEKRTIDLWCVGSPDAEAPHGT